MSYVRSKGRSADVSDSAGDKADQKDYRVGVDAIFRRKRLNLKEITSGCMHKLTGR